MKKLSKETVLLIIFILIFAILSLMSPGKFLTMSNIRSMCFQIPEFGLFAIAMMLTIITGGINLSVVLQARWAALSARLCSRVHGQAAWSGLVYCLGDSYRVGGFGIVRPY